MAFNSNDYGWKNISVGVNGTLIESIQGASWKEKVDSAPVYGKGNKPRGIQDGNYSYEGQLTLLQSDFRAILKASGNKGLKGLRDMVIDVAYEDDLGGLMTTSCVGVRITEIGEESKQGDKEIPVTLPFIALDEIHAQ